MRLAADEPCALQVERQRLHVHALGLMPDEDALDLFHAKLGEAASQAAVCKKMEDAVVRACGRLPLALAVIGGCLAGVEDEGHWQVMEQCLFISVGVACVKSEMMCAGRTGGAPGGAGPSTRSACAVGVRP
jgi:hypothetical protein